MERRRVKSHADIALRAGSTDGADSEAVVIGSGSPESPAAFPALATRTKKALSPCCSMNIRYSHIVGCVFSLPIAGAEET
jgi:hypothetical protein